MTTPSWLGYFDLTRQARVRVVRKAKEPQSASQLPQYLALSLGVLVQPFFSAYRNGQSWDADWRWIIFAILVTVTIFPAVYRRAWDPDKPLFVQLCAIFSTGLGWHTLLATGARAAGV